MRMSQNLSLGLSAISAARKVVVLAASRGRRPSMNSLSPMRYELGLLCLLSNWIKAFSGDTCLGRRENRITFRRFHAPQPAADTYCSANGLIVLSLLPPRRNE